MSYPAAPRFLDDARFSYDLANPGQYRYWKFVYDNLAQQDITLASTTQFQRINETFDATSRATACEFESIPSNSNQCTILQVANDTQFTKKFITTTDYDALVMDIQWNFAIGMNVSTYSLGNFGIDSVSLTLRSWRAQDRLAYQTTNSWTSTLTKMTALDNQVMIIQDVMKTPIPLYRGGALETEITVNTTTGTGTSQTGIIPIFPYQATGALRTFSESGYRSLLRAMPTSGQADVESTYTQYARPALTQSDYSPAIIVKGDYGGLNS